MVLFAALLIIITASLNRKTELLHQQEVFAGNLTRLETLVNQANRLAMQVAVDNEILGVFIPLDEPDSTAGGGANYFDDQLLDTIRIGSVLAGVNGVDGFADRISVFNRYGDYVSTGRLYETPERIAETLGDIGPMDALTEELMEIGDHFLVAGFHQDLWSNNPNTQFVSLYRTLSYTETSNPYGLVSVQMQADRLLSLDFWGDGENGAYALLSDRRSGGVELLYPLAESLPAEAIYTAVKDSLAENRVVCLPFAQEGKEFMLLAARVSGSNWLLARALPVDALTTPYRSTYAIMILGCLALMALFLIVVNYMAERISRPLRELSATIGGVSLSNMRLSTDETRPTYSTQELIALDEAFRGMLTRLDASIALEMQAYMRVLQAQMNPHFLYNMLSVIIGSSESAGDERTVSMCLRLAAMLRYIAEKRDRVPLRDELQHARNYMELMKERYEDLFTFEIETDDAVLDVMIPKLTVQPLAENCFMHGFAQKPPWHIHVGAHVEGSAWRFTVEDNGVGMSDEEIGALLSHVERYKQDLAGNYQELSLGGMGLINTLLRLSLLSQGATYHVIANRPEGGLRIEIGGMPHDSCHDR